MTNASPANDLGDGGLIGRLRGLNRAGDPVRKAPFRQAERAPKPYWPFSSSSNCSAATAPFADRRTLSPSIPAISPLLI